MRAPLLDVSNTANNESSIVVGFQEWEQWGLHCRRFLGVRTRTPLQDVLNNAPSLWGARDNASNTHPIRFVPLLLLTPADKDLHLDDCLADVVNWQHQWRTLGTIYHPSPGRTDRRLSRSQHVLWPITQHHLFLIRYHSLSITSNFVAVSAHRMAPL